MEKRFGEKFKKGPRFNDKGVKQLEGKMYELDVCYTDYYIEVYEIEISELSSFVKKLIDESIPTFEIEEKVFLKKEINSIGFGSWGVLFNHENKKEKRDF